MKKLKCESCGATLKVDENNEYASCEFCNSKYKLNEDVNVNVNYSGINEVFNNDIFKSNSRIQKIISIVFLLVFISLFSITIFSFFRNFSEASNAEINADIENFNHKYEYIYGEGLKTQSSLSSALDSIIKDNRKKDNIIEVIYNGTTTSDIDKIKSIKKSLTNDRYEIEYKYNKKGYIYQIVITDVE